MTGKISTFGGPNDSGMTRDEGLALYWTHEICDMWPDLFLPRSIDLAQGMAKRLRPEALYFAYRFGNTLSKDQLRRIPWIMVNKANGKRVMVRLVDWGPHERTGRVFDVSPMVADLLGVKTDDELEGFALA